MTISDEDIRQQLRLGEDSRWEFKQIEFSGNTPTSPRREDLADELGAFANAGGGVLLCGVSDDGRIPSMSREQMHALDHLLVEVSTDTIEPALRIGVHHRELDESAFVLVEVPKGDAVHERSRRAFIRVGATKRRLDGDERLRLAQTRAQTRYLWFDKQIVPQTGFETLDERLWEPLLSVAGAADPRRALRTSDFWRRMKVVWIGPQWPGCCFAPSPHTNGCRKPPLWRHTIAAKIAPPVSWMHRKSGARFQPRSPTL